MVMRMLERHSKTQKKRCTISEQHAAPRYLTLY